MPAKADRKFYRSLAPLIRPADVAATEGGWSAIFGRSAPLELEIGFGNGESLARRTLAHPERDFVGVELAWNSLKRALRRLGAPPRTNARLLWMPAEPALARLFPTGALAMVRCLFPVPWPRERQARKRLFHRGFLDLLADRLAPDGLFHLVTDSEPLAEWALDQARDSALSLSISARPPVEDTKYERKWRLGGQDVFHHLHGVKRACPDDAPAPGPFPMPPRLSPVIDPRDYRPSGRSGSPAVVFGELVYDDLRGEGLLPAKVAEDGFVQEFHVRLTRLADGRHKVSPALPGQVLPTAGVALALDLAAMIPPAPKAAPGNQAPRDPATRNQVAPNPANPNSSARNQVAPNQAPQDPALHNQATPNPDDQNPAPAGGPG
jgi:tRNA (guanine-N7-)-methyltransferase